MLLTKRLVTTLVIILVALVACGADESSNARGDADLERNRDGYTDITVEQLDAMMDDKDFVLVNVHIPYEGEIPQTDLFIPFNEIESHLDQLPGKDEAIVLYCRSGSMSTTAAEDLAQLGYTNVMELDGGFRAWTAAGNELINEP